MVYASWETQFGFGPPITPVLTRLTTHKGHLPQGSPTSGYLANLALIPCIPQIRAVVESLGCTVSFYVDDITISGERARETIEPVTRFLMSLHLRVGHRKTTIMGKRGPRSTTGLNVPEMAQRSAGTA